MNVKREGRAAFMCMRDERGLGPCASWDMARRLNRHPDGNSMRKPVPSLRAALSTVVALSIPAAAEVPIFTADQEACFGRVYDQAHLASHPQQTVTSLHVLRSLGARPDAENWRPNERGELIQQFRENGTAGVSAFFTFRDRKGVFNNWFDCHQDAAAGVRCSVACDGGSFGLNRVSPDAVLLKNDGFVLVGGCGEPGEDEGKEFYFKPGADDKAFRLDLKPVAACRAEEQKVTGVVRAEKPLRERFKEDETFCFGRDYDETHLASHPRQLVRTIRVGRLDPAGEHAHPISAGEPWWFNVALDVKVTVRTGGASATAHYACTTPRQSSWDCVSTTPEGGGGAGFCDGRVIEIVRGPGDDIYLQNPGSGLPVAGACATARDTGSEAPPPPTRSDDRAFRLARMPVTACR
jgi:hypothetical protein